jgi:hypothetical protein
MAGTQVNYVNSRGSRGALVAGDVLDSQTVIRTTAALRDAGRAALHGRRDDRHQARRRRRRRQGVVQPARDAALRRLIHTLVVGDFRQNSTVVNAWTYSDLNRLYNYEVGEWSGCASARPT